MANNPRAIDARVREAHQRAYMSVPTLAEKIPGVTEIGVQLSFMLPSGQPHSSPHKRIFLPDMQAFFEIHCPDRDCMGGGFDLAPAIQAATRPKKAETTGTMQCQGAKGRTPCEISLRYDVDARRD